MYHRILLVVALCIQLFFTSDVAQGNPWFSETGRYVAFPSDVTIDWFARMLEARELSIWDLQELKEVTRLSFQKTINQENPRIFSCAVSEHSECVATVTEKSLSLWSLKTGELLWTDEKKDEQSHHTTSVSFLPQGRQIATISDFQGKSRIRFRDTTTGDIVRQIEDAKITEGSLSVSPDGTRVYAYLKPDSSRKLNLACWSTVEGTRLASFDCDDAEGRVGVLAAGVNFVVEIVDMGHQNRELKWDLIIWDVSQSTELRRVPFNTDRVRQIQLMEDQESVLLTTDVDDRLQGDEYSLATGKLVSSYLIPNGLREVLALTQHGITRVPGTSCYCWISNNARSGLVFGERRVPKAGGIALQLEALSGRRDTAALLAGELKGIVTGKPEVVTIFQRVGGRREDSWERKDLAPRLIRQDAKAVHQTMKSLLKPLPAREVVKTDPSKPRLLVMSAGVTDYDQNEFDRRDSAHDAYTVSATLQKNHAGQFRDVQTKLLTDKQVNNESLREGFEWLKRSATAKDWVVVYLAGHALQAEKGLYYFPHDADNLDLQNTCLNWSEIAKALKETKAAHVMFVLDCNHAGAFGKVHHSTQKKFATEFMEATHISVLASCEAGESPAESEGDEDHGALARAFLEGWSGKADADSNQETSWSELASFARDQVVKLTKGAQHPVVLQSAKSAPAIRVVGK